VAYGTQTVGPGRGVEGCLDFNPHGSVVWGGKEQLKEKSSPRRFQKKGSGKLIDELPSTKFKRGDLLGIKNDQRNCRSNCTFLQISALGVGGERKKSRCPERPGRNMKLNDRRTPPDKMCVSKGAEKSGAGVPPQRKKKI